METAALYIHIPFCHRKCGYCDFYSEAWNNTDHAPFIRALEHELHMRADDPVWLNRTFDTIYIGGGTPSVLNPALPGRLLDTIRKKLSVSDTAEVTIEVNPESVDSDKLKSYRDMGINRISIGVQSLDDRELRILGRLHTAADAYRAVEQALHAGFDNISIDLMFAIPGQKLEKWQQNVNAAVQLCVQHLSMYGLTYEPDTPFDRKRKAGTLRPAMEETERAMYLGAIESAGAYGFLQYEISNFALTGYSSQHNQKYWDGNPYLGLGPSAHSYIKPVRSWNVASIAVYQQLLDNGKLPVAGRETLSLEQQEIEFVMLRLRTREGLDMGQYHKRFNAVFSQKYNVPLTRLEKAKASVLKIDGNSIRLTPHGFLLYDEIIRLFTRELYISKSKAVRGFGRV